MYRFFKVSYKKLSILVFVLLCVAGVSGEYQLACWMSLLFIGTAFFINILHHFERKHYDAQRNPEDSE